MFSYFQKNFIFSFPLVKFFFFFISAFLFVFVLWISFCFLFIFINFIFYLLKRQDLIDRFCEWFLLRHADFGDLYDKLTNFQQFFLKKTKFFFNLSKTFFVKVLAILLKIYQKFKAFVLKFKNLILDKKSSMYKKQNELFKNYINSFNYSEKLFKLLIWENFLNIRWAGFLWLNAGFLANSPTFFYFSHLVYIYFYSVRIFFIKKQIQTILKYSNKEEGLIKKILSLLLVSVWTRVFIIIVGFGPFFLYVLSVFMTETTSLMYLYCEQVDFSLKKLFNFKIKIMWPILENSFKNTFYLVQDFEKIFLFFCCDHKVTTEKFLKVNELLKKGWELNDKRIELLSKVDENNVRVPKDEFDKVDTAQIKVIILQLENIFKEIEIEFKQIKKNNL